MTKTRRAYLVAPRKFEIGELEIAPGPGEVLLKVAACGLCNWELNHWKGLFGKCPQALGHEWSGTVVEVGESVASLKVGDRVTGYEGGPAFSDYFVNTEKNCVKLAPQVTLEEALGEPLACVVNVVRGAAPEAGDIGVVIGCGPMGLWCIQMMAGALLGALVAVDISPAKLELARKFGGTHIINPHSEDAAARLAEISGGHMADFVIEGTGKAENIKQAITCLREGRGRLAIMSTYESPVREFDWMPAIYKGLVIMTTHPGFSINPMDDLRRATILLANSALKMTEVISHRFPLEKIQEAFETLENKPPDYLKGMVIP